jgi:hypothetical protein
LFGPFVARAAAGAGDGAWSGCTPRFDSHCCCSADSGRLLLLLEPSSDVVTLHQHAGRGIGQVAVGVGQVREHPVRALPVQRPRAVPVLIGRRQLLREYGSPLRVLPQAALNAFDITFDGRLSAARQ